MKPKTFLLSLLSFMSVFTGLFGQTPDIVCGDQTFAINCFLPNNLGNECGNCSVNFKTSDNSFRFWTYTYNGISHGPHYTRSICMMQAPPNTSFHIIIQNSIGGTVILDCTFTIDTVEQECCLTPVTLTANFQTCKQELTESINSKDANFECRFCLEDASEPGCGGEIVSWNWKVYYLCPTYFNTTTFTGPGPHFIPLNVAANVLRVCLTVTDANSNTSTYCQSFYDTQCYEDCIDTPNEDSISGNPEISKILAYQDGRNANSAESNTTSISPNPTNGLLTIKHSGNLEELWLVDGFGRKKAFNIHGIDKQIDLSMYENGVYFLFFVNDGIVFDKKKVILLK